MREFSSIYKADSGLRKYRSNQDAGDGLSICYNMVPDTTGLKGYTPVVNPVTDPGGLIWPIVLDWPFPQLFCLKKMNILATRLGVYLLNASFVPTIEVGIDERETIWSVADFQDYILMTNGALMYEVDIASNTINPCSLSKFPLAKMVCNFKGQLVACGVSGYDLNMVVWGPIGEVSLAQTSANGSGYMPMDWSGEAYEVKQLGNFLVIYGSGGITALKPVNSPISTFGSYTIARFGIAERGVVAGDDKEHVFISESGKLFRLSGELELTELGYQEFFSVLIDSGSVMASFVEEDRSFIFSNEVSCYLLNSSGLCQIHQLITSAHMYGGRVIGIFGDTGYVGANVCTDTFDYGLRAIKSIQSIETSSSWNRVGVNFSLDGVTFQSSPQFPFNPQNQANAKVAGNALSINLQNDSYVNKRLDSVKINWKLVDKRFIRGTYAAQTTAGSDS